MHERSIPEEEVELALQQGIIIKEYPHDLRIQAIWFY